MTLSEQQIGDFPSTPLTASSLVGLRMSTVGKIRIVLRSLPRSDAGYPVRLREERKD
jgi:hypothetical protein